MHNVKNVGDNNGKFSNLTQMSLLCLNIGIEGGIIRRFKTYPLNVTD